MKKIIQIPALMFLSGIAQADIYSDAEASMNVKESVFQNQCNNCNGLRRDTVIAI
jgi:hypothetical protein